MPELLFFVQFVSFVVFHRDLQKEREEVSFETERWMKMHALVTKRKIDDHVRSQLHCAPACNANLKPFHLQEKLRYRTMFDMLDVDKSGVLDINELVEAMQQLGIIMTREELAAVISLIDANGDSGAFPLAFCFSP